MHPSGKISAALVLGLLAGWIAGRIFPPNPRMTGALAKVQAPVVPPMRTLPGWQSWLDAFAPLAAPSDANAFWSGIAAMEQHPAPRQELFRDEAFALMPQSAFGALVTDNRFIQLNPEKLPFFRTDGRAHWKPSWWLRLWESGPDYAIRAAGTLPSPFLNGTLQSHLSQALARTDPDIGLTWIQTLADPYNPLADYLGTVATHDLDKARELWNRLPSGGPTRWSQHTAAAARKLAASAIVRQWARTDWQAAMAWVASQLPREDAQQTMSSMLAFMDPEKSKEILAAAVGIKDPGLRSLAYSHALTAERNIPMEAVLDKALALPANALDKAGWDLLGQRSAGLVPRTADPVAEAAKLKALADRVPETYRQGYIEHAAMMAGWNNKPLAGQLLEYLPDGNVGMMAGDWVEQDPMAASIWLAALPASPKRDAAVTGFCRALSPLDPQSAAEWALTVQDDARRASALQDAVGAWKQKDPEAVRTWLDEAGVDVAGF